MKWKQIIPPFSSYAASSNCCCKIQAVRAAKEKAGYLAEAIGEQAGVAVTINEPVEYYTPFINMRMANQVMRQQEASADMATDQAAVDFRKIKLRFDVTAVFALK